MNSPKIVDINEKCEYIVGLIKRMIKKAGSGHAGASLSIVEILSCLYFSVLKHDPHNTKWDKRDRFILSKGHSGLALYATLSLAGYFPEKILDTYATTEGPLMNHPDAHLIPGVEVSTGSLGHGLPIAVGVSLAGLKRSFNYFTFCLLGDGECHEGTVWEAAMAASSFKLNRLIVIVDRNRFGNDGEIDYINLEPFEEKWKSFGWKTKVVDGHNTKLLTKVLKELKVEAKGPYTLIANTTKGRGLISAIAGKGNSHYISGTEEYIESLFIK